jgi:hypothetical protein
MRQFDFVAEAIVFGQNREHAGVLIFPNRAGPWKGFVNLINSLPALNAKLPPHARIAKELVVVVTQGRPWPKSTQGTALRCRAEMVFAREIEQARHRYANTIREQRQREQQQQQQNQHQHQHQHQPNQQSQQLQLQMQHHVKMELVVAQLVEKSLGRRIDINADFFMAGVDSMMAISLRRQLMRSVNAPLPLNVVFEKRTIKKCAPTTPNDASVLTVAVSHSHCRP